MSEFKLSQGLSDEISALRNAGIGINSSYSELLSDGVSTLKTSMHYIELCEKIKELMELYGKLLAKDASDLEEMMAAVYIADNAGSTTFG